MAKRPWTTKQLEKLCVLFGKLGSEHHPETEAAHTRLLKMLKDHGCSWSDLPDLIKQSTTVPPAPPPPPQVPPGGPITGLELFRVLRAMFARYVHFPNPLYYDAAALWTLHTHVCHHFKHTPRLHLRSNIEGEGKSTVFDVLEPLVANARRSDNTTSAAVMREADERPIKTLQLDEADNLNLMTDPTFRAVLNSGYSRQGRRTIVVNGIATTYRTFAPIALAGIASLPSPLMRRSIIFDIRRASRDELKTLMEIDDQDPVQKEEFDVVHAAITHWAHHVELERFPALPDELPSSPRAAWRPLISIADACGVGEVARKTTVELSRGFGENPKVQLLAHIRAVFNATLDELVRPEKAEPHNHLVNDRRQLSTSTILANLHNMDALWSVWCGEDGRQAPRPLTGDELGKLLRGFKIYSGSLWPSPRERGPRAPRVTSDRHSRRRGGTTWTTSPHPPQPAPRYYYAWSSSGACLGFPVLALATA